ncbi:CheF family chemotaxis protein [Halobium salinum]|uniref:Taxis protein CheF n=1 Tax=Halobium salinum TaxID=1364940 RepID=A0ABD5PH18_9EURY|nr:CheF family chemotaxis protein [Halobium salinum]
MTESIVADFVGRFQTPEHAGAEPVTGRILLSRKRLVLAADAGKTTVPLSSVFDVSVGFVPAEMEEFFDDTVTVAYTEKGAGNRTVVIEGKGTNVDKFASVLFKTLLSGTKTYYRHPAKVGGRVTDAPVRKGKLKLEPRRLAFVGSEPLSIDLTTVTNIGRTHREFGGSSREVLAVSHMDGGSAITTDLAVSSRRKTNVLGRYVRLEYASFVEEIADLEQTEEELEALVAVYSAGGAVDLGSLLDAEPAQVTMVLNSLREDDLVVDREEATELTPKGRVVVTRHLEDVNF